MTRPSTQLPTLSSGAGKSRRPTVSDGKNTTPTIMQSPGRPPRPAFAAVFASTAGMLVVLLLLSGCGDGRPQRVPVSGQVLLDGQPLTFGVIRFVPKGARASSGQIDPEGRFKLVCFDQQDGAVLGEHRIEVAVYKNDGESSTRWYIPKRYGNCATSGLVVNITGPTDDLVIELSSK